MRTFRFSRKNLSIPYVIFLAVFVVIPLFVLVYYAFTDRDGHVSLRNFIGFFTDPNTLGTLFYSIVIALTTTLVCLAIAYPTAYILAKSRVKRKSAMLLVFILPMWINFSLRITALKEILTVLEEILPIYTTISRLDPSLIEAAKDLGANDVDAFFKITLPLSVPGIVSGVAMVFLPAMTNYVVLDMLYNSTYIMGSLIGSYFAAYNWNGGSLIALILLLLICVFTYLTRNLEDEDQRAGGGALL